MDRRQAFANSEVFTVAICKTSPSEKRCERSLSSQQEQQYKMILIEAKYEMILSSQSTLTQEQQPVKNKIHSP